MKIKLIYLFFGCFFSNIAFSQGVNFKLAKIKSGSYKCEVFFEVTNSSGLNLTFGNADLTLREKDGSIIDKNTLLFNRIKKDETIVTRALVGEPNCAIIGSIKIQLRAVSVDGDLDYKKQDIWLPVVNRGTKSSSIPGIVVN